VAATDVRVVAFDVNETLFSLDRLRDAFTAAGLDPAAVPLWFAQLLRDGFALTAMGQYQSFRDLAAQALRNHTSDEDALTAIIGAFRELDPHPDVAPALRMLADAGVPAVTLTNGSTSVVEALLSRADLLPLVQRRFSADEVRRWKPAPDPYRWTATQLEIEPGQLALVASHPWDCAGARAAGLVSGWVNRTGAGWPTTFTPPDVTAPDLPTMVTALLGHDRRER
jgi:2-haloacid dehalogenase